MIKTINIRLIKLFLMRFFAFSFALFLICGMVTPVVADPKIRPSYDSINEALRKDPNDFEARLRKANAEAAALEDPQALEDYNKLIKLRPLSSDAYLHRSECYMHMGKFELGEQDLKSCIKVCKQVKTVASYADEGEATMRLSRRLSSRGELKEALALMEQLSEKSRGSREMVAKAECECHLGLFEKAQADFDIGLVSRPRDPDSLLLKAECFMKAKKYESAVVAYSTAISEIRKTDNNFTSKNRFRLLDGRALAYRNLGKKALADKDVSDSQRARNELFDFMPFRDNSLESPRSKSN